MRQMRTTKATGTRAAALAVVMWAAALSPAMVHAEDDAGTTAGAERQVVYAVVDGSGRVLERYVEMRDALRSAASLAGGAAGGRLYVELRVRLAAEGAEPASGELPPVPRGARLVRVPDDAPSLAEALKRVRTGVGDRVLLRRGGVYDADWIKLGGAGEDAPFIVGAYGDGPRPVVRITDRHLGVGGDSGATVSHVWLVGLDIYRASADPSSPAFVSAVEEGIRLVRCGRDIRVIGCRLRYCGFIAVNSRDAGRIDGVRIVDTSIAFTNAAEGHSGGIYMSGVDNWEIRNVLIYRTGWNADTGEGRTTFDQGIYIHDGCGHGVAEGVVAVENAASGAQFRSPATIDGVIAIGNHYGINLGRGGSKFREGGIVVNARRMYVNAAAPLDGKDGQGFDIANLLPESTIEDVIAHEWIGVAGKDTDGLAGCHARWRNIYATQLTWYGPNTGYSGASMADSELVVMKWRDGKEPAPPNIEMRNVRTDAPRRSSALPEQWPRWLRDAEQRWAEPGYDFESAWRMVTEQR